MLQKSEGFRFGVAKGEAVANYCDPLAALNLEFSGFPEGEKKMEKIEHIVSRTICAFRIL